MEIHNVSGPDLAAQEAVSRTPTRPPEPPKEEPERAEAAQEEQAPEKTQPLAEHLGNQPTRTGHRLYVDEATERVVAEILDENDEVIKQIPQEEQLQAIARTRAIQGILFDELI